MSEWIKAAKAGDKVVAIKTDKQPPSVGVPVPVGTVLTIREIKGAVRSSGFFQIGLLFEEIKNEAIMTSLGVWELDYDHECFRPVTPRKTDISVFTDMLKTVGKPIEEHA